MASYYVLYMEKAVENYMKGSTTIVQRKENASKLKSPIFLICPEPPFKRSFFNKHGVNNTIGAEKYFWTNPMYQNAFTNHTFMEMEPMDLYMNMSYQLGLDMNISLYQLDYEYVYFRFVCRVNQRKMHPLSSV